MTAEPSFALTSQPWLEALLSGSAEGIALCGPAGDIVRANPRLRELLGDASGALEGRRLETLFADPAWPLASTAAPAPSRRSSNPMSVRRTRRAPCCSSNRSG